MTAEKQPLAPGRVLLVWGALGFGSWLIIIGVGLIVYEVTK